MSRRRSLQVLAAVAVEWFTNVLRLPTARASTSAEPAGQWLLQYLGPGCVATTYDPSGPRWSDYVYMDDRLKAERLMQDGSVRKVAIRVAGPGPSR